MPADRLQHTGLTGLDDANPKDRARLRHAVPGLARTVELALRLENEGLARMICPDLPLREGDKALLQSRTRVDVVHLVHLQLTDTRHLSKHFV